MTKPKIAIGSDHAGFEEKEKIKKILIRKVLKFLKNHKESL